jgi:Fe-S-cluster-containing hydrogenase component 2
MANGKNIGIAGCKGCLKCLNICTEHALENHNGHVRINSDKCTLCLSCLDACPYGSIVFID